MEKQSPRDTLKESIRLLEIRQAEEGAILKEQFKVTFESLKLVNLVRSSLKELSGSGEIKNSLLETIVSIFTGYFTKKIMIKSGSNPLLKILGAMLQFGVTTLVARNAEKLRTLVAGLIDRFLHPEEEKEEELPDPEI
jgi:hypothetical protein